MPQTKWNQPNLPPSADSLESLSAMNLEQWIEALKSSDRLFNKTMAIEVWAIAKTMDDLFPGFWNRFMANRRAALDQFIKQKRAAKAAQNNQISTGEPERGRSDDSSQASAPDFSRAPSNPNQS